jgi:hypothetical protein
MRKPGYQDEFLFVDVNNHVQGVFELLPALGDELVPSQQIEAQAFTPQIVDWDTSYQVYRSGALAARNTVGQHAGFYSVAVYTQNYTGKFSIQASLENLSPTDVSWFTVPINSAEHLQITPDSPPVVPINFGINARWIRFIYDTDLNNKGEFVKVLYKIS